MTKFNVGDTVVATGEAWVGLKGELGKVTALHDDRPDRPLVVFAEGGLGWLAWGEYAVELVEAADVAQEETNEVPADAINPAHYQGFSNGAQVIDITENLTPNLANVVKYAARAGRKTENPVEDLRKAEWYLARELVRIGASHGQS